MYVGTRQRKIFGVDVVLLLRRRTAVGGKLVTPTYSQWSAVPEVRLMPVMCIWCCSTRLTEYRDRLTVFNKVRFLK